MPLVRGVLAFATPRGAGLAGGHGDWQGQEGAHLMRRQIGLLVAALAAGLFGQSAHAVTINGNQIALRSGGGSGSDSGTARLITGNGYVGTYVTLAAPGDVTVTVNAQGTLGGGPASRMNIVVDDELAPFDVSAAADNYAHTFALPAGTHFIRTEYTNDFVSNSIPAASRQLRINTLDVAGGTLNNANNDANSLAAADTYIQNYRKGPAHVALLGATPGAPVQVTLADHAFNFGGAIPRFNATETLNVPAFTNFVKENFNMVVGTNAGKWSTNEATRDVVDMSYSDQIMNFAQANGMRARQHAMLWGDQQPGFVTTMVNSPAAIDSATGLTNQQAFYGAPNSEVSERIDYYVGDGDADQNDGDRARKYVELDVYNESVHTGVNRTPSIWNTYGPTGVSNIFKEVQQAVDASGSSAKLYLNEYNILQNGDDPWGTWYRNHIEAVQNADGNPADGPVGGIGMQYYALPGHSAGYMRQVLENMSVTGLPLSLTEFGVQDNLSISSDNQPESAVIQTVTEAMRMMFGSPNATTFMYWGWSSNLTSDLQRASVLVDGTYQNLTNVGKAYQDLLGIHDWDGNPNNGWTTDLPLTVGADGTIDFTGFYGKYYVTAAGHTYLLDLTKGTTDYSLVVGPPSGDFDFDGDVDGADLIIWQQGLGTTPGATFAQGDADYNGVINQADLAVILAAFGQGGATASAARVPEPSCAALAAVALIGCVTRERRKQTNTR